MMLQQLDGVLRCATSARVYSRTVELGVGVGVGVMETEGLGFGVGVGEGAGDAFTATPLLQTLLLPFFRQVNLRFFEIETVPTFLQGAPALGVFAAALLNELVIRNTERRKTKARRISEF